MQPRLKTSKKWTSFPTEYTDQIKSVFEENFEPDLDDEKIEVEGRIYTSEVLLRVGLIRPGQLRQANFEASMDYSPKTKDALERIHNTVDAVASMIADYFEKKEEADLPLAFQEYPFQGKKIFLRFSTMNAELEKQADALLGELADDLVIDKEETIEDALAFAEVDPSLSVDEEELPDQDADSDDEDDESTDETSQKSKTTGVKATAKKNVDPQNESEDSAASNEKDKGPKMFSGPKTKTIKKLH